MENKKEFDKIKNPYLLDPEDSTYKPRSKTSSPTVAQNILEISKIQA